MGFGGIRNGGMFRRLHNSVWETLQDTTTESSEGYSQKKRKCHHNELQLERRCHPRFIIQKQHCLKRKKKKSKERQI